MAISTRHMLVVLETVLACLMSACGGGGDLSESNTGSTPAALSDTAQAVDPAAVSEPDGLAAASTEDSASTFPAAELDPGVMKWNPGHYVVFMSDATNETIDAGLREIRNLPFVKGIVLRAYWSQLETEKNVYSFGRIDRQLAKAAAQKKRFFLLLSIRGFSLGSVAPKYLQTPFYGGGTYKFKNARGTFGENLTLWNDHVRDRLTLLLKALAQRYNGNPHFEGVIMGETAFGQPVESVSEAQKAGYYESLTRLDTAARWAFRNTVVIQFVNFPVDRTPPIVANLLDKGVGFGAPDVFVDDPLHNKYIYSYNDQVRGRIPIGMQVEHHSYRSTHAGGPLDPPPVRDIYVFARDRLHSNYVFWERDLREPLLAWPKVLQMFRSADFSDTPSGGLTARCPAKYRRCVSTAP